MFDSDNDTIYVNMFDVERGRDSQKLMKSGIMCLDMKEPIIGIVFLYQL